MFDIRRLPDDMYEVFYKGKYEGTVWGEGNKNVLLQAILSRENPSVPLPDLQEAFRAARASRSFRVIEINKAEIVITEDSDGIVSIDVSHPESGRTVLYKRFHSVEPFCLQCGSLIEVGLPPLEDDVEGYVLHCPSCDGNEPRIAVPF